MPTHLTAQLQKHFRLFAVLAVCVVTATAALTYVSAQPPYTISLICNYQLSYDIEATIHVDGRDYTARATHQHVWPHTWTGGMNMNGCQQPEGTGMAFRLEDNRVVLISATLCDEAREALGVRNTESGRWNFDAAMRERRSIDPRDYCAGGIGRHAAQYDYEERPYSGYIFDDADAPTAWRGFHFNQNGDQRARVLLTQALVTARRASPRDDMEDVAPGLFSATLEDCGGYYTFYKCGPAEIIPWQRRSNSAEQRVVRRVP